eukprot:TRINITY_DN28068_c0_g1_i1.p1 TRINITY_DN28068_c0_g1~~TRINITY_DN28068_c0_g1_i1.p1  ORF type:complete len:281 (+),score=115.57 TRINITY_DN28068_c0_g1_i1:26-868(+)
MRAVPRATHHCLRSAVSAAEKMDTYTTGSCQGGGTFYRYEMTSSTMDRAKELCKAHAPTEWLLVSAVQQASGRGTGGRTWVSPQGNVYISICVPKDPSVLPVDRLMFLPLETGLAVTRAVARMLPSATTSVLPQRNTENVVSQKWPNDVLINDFKVSGNLIEDGGSHMIVGIGVNVAVAPKVADGGRPAGCLHAHGCTATDEEVGQAIFSTLRNNILAPKRDVVAEFSSTLDWHRSVFERNSDGTRGNECTPVRLTEHGHLVVTCKSTGKEKTLINEYLF